MAERRARDLTGKPLGKFSCTHCQQGKCDNCMDIMRVIVGLEAVCQCTKKGHGGEPRDQQIKDPETGTVYAPGLTVSEEGEVKRT